MCRLRVKVRVTGKKNQEFIRFILVPKDRRQRSNYILSFGYWDTRKNSQIRFIPGWGDISAVKLINQFNIIKNDGLLLLRCYV